MDPGLPRRARPDDAHQHRRYPADGLHPFLGNIVLVETVFGWPGMGRLAVDAIQTVDVPLIMGAVVTTAYIVVISSIVTDSAHTLLDPRVRMA